MNIKTVYNCKITALSPLFIGSGEEISGLLDYIPNGDKIVILDWNKLLNHPKIKDKEDEINNITDDIEEGRLDLKKFLNEKNIKLGEVEKYRINLSQSIGKNAIKNFIKTNGKPYIPGSSMKGAIRTCLLFYIIKEDKNKEREVLRRINHLIGNYRIKAKYADDEIDNYIFQGDGGTYFDFLRSLQLSDTESIPVNNLQVSEIGIMTIGRNNTYSWKNWKIYLESIMRNVIFQYGKISIDNFLLENLFKDYKDLYNVSKICNFFADILIDEELKFLNYYNFQNELNNVINFYNNLKTEIKDLNDNEFFLRLSWGSGWDGMTIGLFLKEAPNQQLLENLRYRFILGKIIHKICNNKVTEDNKNKGKYYCKRCRMGNIGRSDVKKIEPFPKTHRICFENNKPKYPVGWIKVRIEE